MINLLNNITFNNDNENDDEYFTIEEDFNNPKSYFDYLAESYDDEEDEEDINKPREEIFKFEFNKKEVNLKSFFLSKRLRNQFKNLVINTKPINTLNNIYA